ncbi:MAG: DNA double-strand break repair nuclease NurA [Candidatus Bathyarchaeia archaeon]
MKKIKETNSIYAMFKNSLVNNIFLNEKTQFLKEDLIPNFLLKLSNSSMETIRDSGLTFIQASPELEIEEEPQLCLNIKDLNEPILINPIYEDSTIVAIDVSSIKIGETNNGVICAIRGAIVWKNKEGVNFFRCGPLLFHINSFIIERLYNNGGFKDTLLEFPVGVVSRLRNLLERFIQGNVCNYFRDSIILFDGSLIAGTPDNPVTNLNQILAKARENRNTVLAISKTTKIGFSGIKLTELLKKIKGPCILDIDENVKALFSNHPVQLLGKVYAAKLSIRGLSFRLDIDKKISFKDAMNSLGKLIVNDVIDQGYPDTLRLAHILSSFTQSDVIGIQRFLSKRFKIQMIPKINLRKILFGPFGSQMEVS